jgi:hypothetical protein
MLPNTTPWWRASPGAFRKWVSRTCFAGTTPTMGHSHHQISGSTSLAATTARSRRVIRASLAEKPPALGIGGRRECRALGAPAASRAKQKAHEHSHHGHTGITRHSPRNGFNGFLRALPGDRACLSPSPTKVAFHRLDAGVEASGPHDFAVRRERASSLRAPSVHRTPTHVRDDRETPLSWDGMIRSIPVSTGPSSGISENQK